MDISTYSHDAYEFAEYFNDDYPFFALVEEVGELMTYIAKHKRGDEKYENLLRYNKAITKEIGDILWQLNACCVELDVDLDDAAKLNLQKLRERQLRGVLKGDGDNR